MAGHHRSPYHGYSVEFAEHRAYGSGDEIRHIDWKLFGKTDRYYIKRFEEETNLKCYLILDQSKSMTFGSGSTTKLDYAQTLTAALAYLMLKQQDAVGLALFDSELRNYLPPRGKASHMKALMAAMSAIVPGPETRMSPMLHQLAEGIRKRGLIVLISDLLDDPDEVMMGLKHFRHKKHEVIVFHVLDPQELEFSYSSRTRFNDLETGDSLTTEPWHIQEIYQQAVNKFVAGYRTLCRQHNIDYVLLRTDQPMDRALSEYLLKRRYAG
ncbi:MAG: DUF58 domain-containing protein [Candidatus Marinimicrobia bacterium]|nr:DUF58 domain-containing protein [Candidatus Neomarinimicrobiota bacterium]